MMSTMQPTVQSATSPLVFVTAPNNLLLLDGLLADSDQFGRSLLRGNRVVESCSFRLVKMSSLQDCPEYPNSLVDE